ncbi:complement C1q tumor necrosis factor-related protein 3-like [Sparus aurata]|uniref:Cerebellin 20 n=1 Tax=Sparus aurata TaxID=8175 RepID=A0A671TG54_SPAAU|nr:complement C1q tumor necrosis factor-related protein 3-like [Sparus aurata]
MRAFVLLCLLLPAFGQYEEMWGDKDYLWDTPGFTTTKPKHKACLYEKESCGCCLMKKQTHRMEAFFNLTHREMKKDLMLTKMYIDDMRASRSAFSFALDKNDSTECLGPFSDDAGIVFRHEFLNLGNNYNPMTGIFVAPRAGVYSFSYTISSDMKRAACAHLQVNGEIVSEIHGQDGQDSVDSDSVVKAIKLKAEDRVDVILPKGCIICSDKKFSNTFTGFLLYATV